LKHSKGEWAGQAFVLSPWQAFILWVLFGWKRKSDGRRRFRTAFIFVPRKNGKTTWMAGLGLFLLVADGEPGAEIYSAATKRDQAKISWEEAVRMVKASPALSELVQHWKSSDTLDVEASNSKFQPLGADGDTMDGLNVHAALIDEVHAHKTSEVVDVLQTATGSRRQPLQVEITTAGFLLNGIGHEHYAYAKNILKGVFEDDTWFAFLAEMDEGDDWHLPHVWAKVNPNLGVSIYPDDLQRKIVEASNRPAALNNLLCKHFNTWVQQEERWIALDKWDAGLAEIDPADLLGQVCYGGLDLSAKVDISAFALLFPRQEGGFYQLSWYWIPEESMREREERDKVPYSVWCDAGWVEATPGNVIDYERIKDKIGQLARLYDMRAIGYDPWSATQTATQLQAEGLETVEVGQRYSTLAEPSKEFERLILGKQLTHDANPVMRWMIDCVSVVTDSNDNIRPAKPNRKKNGKRIDGVAATINALFCAMRSEEGSVYDERGVLLL
jgi:phage terminase large subunit-like protein